MTELLDKTIRDITLAADSVGGEEVDYFLPESEWYAVRDQLSALLKKQEIQGAYSEVSSDHDYPLQNFWLSGVRVCIKAPIDEEDGA